jgi:acetyl esterase
MAFTAVSSGADLQLNKITNGSAPDSVIYKTVGSYKLKLYVFCPEGFKAGDKRTGIVWIHGGGWRGGQPSMFFPHCRYYASRGTVAFCVQYRFAKENGPTVSDCISDCKSVMRFIRAHADSFGVDPGKLAVMGDSAGGHLAACLGVTDGHNDPSDNMSVSAEANAMVLYNPVVDLTTERWVKLFEAKDNKTAEQLAREASPLFDIKADEPPCMVIHGYADTVVPPSQAMDFARMMVENKNRCDLMLLGMTNHAFVIPGYTGTEETVVRSIRAGDDFLVSIGMLKGQPNLVINKK